MRTPARALVRLRARSRRRSARLGTTRLVVGLPPERVGEIAAANGIVLHELDVEQATLEEVFLELTGGETTE